MLDAEQIAAFYPRWPDGSTNCDCVQTQREAAKPAVGLKPDAGRPNGKNRTR